ncbi:MAG: BrnT family toxin [Steroidobacteraceae bacterium]
MIDWACITGFDWDEGNSRKSSDKHDVSQAEAEQVFFNAPLQVAPDSEHSAQEARLHALGKTDRGRQLHVTFTLRKDDTLIRVISARDMSRKEREFYGESESTKAGEEKSDESGNAEGGPRLRK